VDQISNTFVGIGDFDLYNATDEDEIVIPSVDVKITFNEDGTFNIFRDFCYPIYDCDENFTSEHLSLLEEVTFSMLKEKFKEEPSSDFDCGMGCPFDDALVGYLNRAYDIEFIKLFVEICEEAEMVDVADKVTEKITETLEARAEQAGLTQLNRDVYTDDKKQVLVFAKNLRQVKIDNIDASVIESISYPVSALHYFCGITNSGVPVATDIKKFIAFSKICNFFQFRSVKLRLFLC
jgi:hypothetical protein